jgi:hypothetical protein
MMRPCSLRDDLIKAGLKNFIARSSNYSPFVAVGFPANGVSNQG